MNFKIFNEGAKKEQLRIDVVGYSDKKFDKKMAKDLLSDCFDEIEKKNEDKEFIVVSGLTNLGIPALAYEEAVRRGWGTAGIACKKAEEYELFDCDDVRLIGEEWGDESETFLNDISVLVKIGGGKQSKEEFVNAKEMGIITYEKDLPETKK